MKTNRKMKILELIQTQDIETQDELLQLLLECGHKVTQATISRDIKELRLVKTLNSDGRYHYTTSQTESSDTTSKLSTLFENSVSNVSNGQNTVCIKCRSGMAQAVCAILDEMDHEGVVGTLAGDDTIFVLCVDTDTAVRMVSKLRKLYAHE